MFHTQETGFYTSAAALGLHAARYDYFSFYKPGAGGRGAAILFLGHVGATSEVNVFCHICFSWGILVDFQADSSAFTWFLF